MKTRSLIDYIEKLSSQDEESQYKGRAAKQIEQLNPPS